MFYGLFSLMCLLIGSVLTGQGLYKDDIRIIVPSTTLFIIGIVIGINWIINWIVKM